MKFLITRDCNNPAWLGVTIDPKTPGFQHPNHFPKGFRFSIGNAETFSGLSESDQKKVAKLKEGQCVVIDDGSPKSNAVISQIDAEVKAEVARLQNMEEKSKQEKLKNSPKAKWNEKSTGTITLIVIGGVILLIITAILEYFFPQWFHS